MTSRIRRVVAGGLLAAATATGIALAGAGTAGAYAPPAPTHEGTEGERAYYQGGNDPNVHLFTWGGGAWHYVGCVGFPYELNIL